MILLKNDLKKDNLNYISLMEDNLINIDNIDKEIIISNIDKYNFKIINNNLYLTPIDKYLKDFEIYRYELKKSEIFEARFNDENIKNPTYYKILKIIWKLTPINILLQHTIFNFKLNIDSVNTDNTYIWNDEINLAFQTRSFNHAFKEIVNLCKINNFKLILKIRLINNNIILFKI